MEPLNENKNPFSVNVYLISSILNYIFITLAGCCVTLNKVIPVQFVIVCVSIYMYMWYFLMILYALVSYSYVLLKYQLCKFNYHYLWHLFNSKCVFFLSNFYKYPFISIYVFVLLHTYWYVYIFKSLNMCHSLVLACV